jgi:hypothetical protein
VGIVGGLLVLGGFYPLCRVWRAARGSTVRHPLAWAMVAWLAWGLAAWRGGTWLHFLALCLTACAGVAVLNARRPHAFAWHFVVAGLLLLLLRPFWEGLGELRLSGLHIAALAVALGVALGNYVPTRLGVAAGLLGGWCGVDLARLTGAIDIDLSLAWPLLAAVPWLAWLSVWRRPASAFDDDWLTFRDRFGFVWAALIREMFNNAARNARWPVVLRWSGLRCEGDVDMQAARATLRALLQRFETEKDERTGFSRHDTDSAG